MGAAGGQLAFDQGGTGKALDDPVAGQGLATARHHGHAGSLDRVTADGGVDFAALPGVTMHQRLVVALDGTRLELADQVGLGFEGFGNHQQAAGVLVEAMHDAGAGQLAEADTVIVIDKPVGLVVHPGSGNWSGTLLNALLHHGTGFRDLPRAGIVHRLDKDTSGLLVVAKTLEAQTDLVRQLQARTVKRHYQALVHGHPGERGEVNAPIGRHPVQRTRMAVVPGGREALTRYRVIERFARASLVECELATGRTHQIRVHMAHIGHPLVGDATYGKARSADPRLDAFPRQALHAWQLGLVHPRTGAPCRWETPLPEDFEDLLILLRSGTAP